jgi:methionyl-tRNA synthetase
MTAAFQKRHGIAEPGGNHGGQRPSKSRAQNRNVSAERHGARPSLNIPEYTWSKAGHRHLIPDGNSLGEPELLFEKIEDATIAQQVEKLHAKKNAATMGNSQTRAIKPHISSDDFSKLDLRIARVVSAEKVPKSDKLLKLTVDTGVGHRVVLSGIGKHFEPQTLIGKQVTILVNLAPRKMMGIESNGMILTVEDQDGSLRLLHPSEIVTPGATIS